MKQVARPLHREMPADVSMRGGSKANAARSGWKTVQFSLVGLCRSGSKDVRAKTRRALVSWGPTGGVRDHTTDPLKVVFARTPCPRALGLTSEQGGSLSLVCVPESPTIDYYCKETGRWKHAPRWKCSLDNAACAAGSTLRHVVPRKREISGSVGVTLRLKELVELELRAIRTIYARKNLRCAPFDIWLKSAFSWVHHTDRDSADSGESARQLEHVPIVVSALDS